MNDIGIFIFGSVLFIGLAWAMIAFGLTRFAELQQQDMQTSTTPSTVQSETSFTDVWVPREGAPEPEDSA